MVDLPRDRVTYPARTGKQGLDSPPAPEPDRTLMDVLKRNSGRSLADVALAVQAAGYRRPQPVHNWVELVDYPRGSMLTDRDGRPWSIDAIPQQLWEKYGPWTLVYTPDVADIPNQ